MIIGIDASCSSGLGGVSSYCNNMIDGLSATGVGLSLYKRKYPGWNTLGLPLKLKSDKPDIFYTPEYFLPEYLPCPGIFSLYDISFETHPGWYDKRFLSYIVPRVRRSVKKCYKIVTLTEFSKDEICWYYRLPEDKVIVTGASVTSEFRNHGATNRAGVLFAGAMYARRHVGLLIGACMACGEKLRLIGEKCGVDIPDNVEWLRNQNKNQIAGCMNKSALFVYLSEYEGYGLTVLEAMACGCPVLALPCKAVTEWAGTRIKYCTLVNVAERIKETIGIMQPAACQFAMEQTPVKMAERFLKGV